VLWSDASGRIGVGRYAPGGVLLSIPSPGDPVAFHLGGLQPRWYGLLIVLAVLAAVWLTRDRFARRGLDPEQVVPVAVCAVPFGLAGARIEHVLTDLQPYLNHPEHIPLVWRGGLGLYGAVIGGMIGALVGSRIVRLPFWVVADCAVPGLLLGQAIGRIGSYANQELYGRPSHLPWAVTIDHPLPPYIPGDSFQPLFLYEAAWDLAVLGLVLWFMRRTANRIGAGAAFALYAAAYSAGRIGIETLRIDPTQHLAGQRAELWVAVAIVVVASAALALLWRRRPAII
jgi:phosphatidylglycerol---prolipoprotein diacylglyceryl transferase